MNKRKNVKNLASGKAKRLKKKKTIGLIPKLIIMAVFIGCIIFLIVTYSKISGMKSELDTIKNKTQEVEAENLELQRILEDDDINAYMEKIAIEEMNYAYPNERRYYDTSRN